MELPVIFITGKSGAGKSKFLQILESLHLGKIVILDQHTTRDSRPGDVHMYYYTPSVFKQMMDDGEFFIVDSEDKYGIKLCDIHKAFASGKIPVATVGRYEIEVLPKHIHGEGAKKHPVVSILIDYEEYSYKHFLERMKLRGDNYDPNFQRNKDRHEFNMRVGENKFDSQERKAQFIDTTMISNSSLHEQVIDFIQRTILPANP